MKNFNTSINEKSPLLENEIYLEKENKIEFTKHIWTLICLNLPLFEILKLTRLNKKLYNYINDNNLLWKRLGNEDTSYTTGDSSDIINQIKMKINRAKDQINNVPINKLDKDNLPSSMYEWKEIKKKCRIIDQEKPKNLKADCIEKQNYIKNYCKENDISTIEKKKYDDLNSIQLCNDFVKYLIVNISPFLVFVCITLLELKIEKVLKFGYVFTLIPIILLSVLYLIYTVFCVVRSEKKYQKFFQLRVSSFQSFVYFPFFCIFSFTIFLVLGSLKLDDKISLNWNVIFAFFYLVFFSFIVGFIILISKKRINFFWKILIGGIPILISSFCIMLHLSVIGVVQSKYKYAFTMIPILVLDFGVLILLIIIFFNLSWYKYIRRIIFNVSIIIGFLCFIFSVVLLFLHLITSINVLYFFILLQISLFFLQTVALQAITDKID